MAGFITVLVQLLWFVMYRVGSVSMYFAIALMSATCGVAIWLLPYFVPVKPAGQGDAGKTNDGFAVPQDET